MLDVGVEQRLATVLKGLNVWVSMLNITDHVYDSGPSDSQSFDLPIAALEEKADFDTL